LENRNLAVRVGTDVALGAGGAYFGGPGLGMLAALANEPGLQSRIAVWAGKLRDADLSKVRGILASKLPGASKAKALKQAGVPDDIGMALVPEQAPKVSWAAQKPQAFEGRGPVSPAREWLGVRPAVPKGPAAQFPEPIGTLRQARQSSLATPPSTPQPWHEQPPLELRPTPAGESAKLAPETGQGTLASQTRQFEAPPQMQQTPGTAITKPDWEGVRARRQPAKINEPRTVRQFVVDRGGLPLGKEMRGEIDEFRTLAPGLVRKFDRTKMLALDELTEAAVNEGLLSEGATESDFLDLLKADLSAAKARQPRIRAGGLTTKAEDAAQWEAQQEAAGGIKVARLVEELTPGDKVRGYLAGTKEDIYTYKGMKSGKAVFKDKQTVELARDRFVEDPERLSGRPGDFYSVGGKGDVPWHEQPPVSPVEAPATKPVAAATEGVAKEPWQQTRAEFRYSEDQPKVLAIHEALRRGKSLPIVGPYKTIYLSSPTQIRIDNVGDVRIPEGKRWVALSGKEIDALAARAGVRPVPFENRIYHAAEVREALAAGRPVPPEVLKDYPDLAPQAQPWHKQKPKSKRRK
jgi:hypothetical protein